jgi:hypothetical protein
MILASRSCAAIMLAVCFLQLLVAPVFAQSTTKSAAPSPPPAKHASDRAARRLRVTLKETGAAQAEGGQVYSTASVDADRGVQQVQVVDGGKVFFRTGQSVPISNFNVAATAAGAIVSQEVRFRDVTNGFYVAPRLAGDVVTAEVSVSRDSPSNVGTGPGSASLLSVITTVSGKLGEWIEIGSVGAREQSGRSISTRSTSTAGGERHILLKFEELH